MNFAKRVVSVAFASMLLIATFSGCGRGNTKIPSAIKDSLESVSSAVKGKTVVTSRSLEEIAHSTGAIVTNTGKYGSGVIIGGDGIVATCFSVIADNAHDSEIVSADFILEYGTDNEIRYPVERVLSYSETSNIAILKIDASGLAPISMGNTDELEPGDDVKVIGAPKGEKAAAALVVPASVFTREVNTNGMEEILLTGDTEGITSGGAVVKAVGAKDHYELVGILATYAEIDMVLSINTVKDMEDLSSTADGASVEEVNNNRKYFIDPRLDENNEEAGYSVGERYDKSTDELQAGAILDILSSSQMYLYDRFTFNEETDKRMLKELSIYRSSNDSYFIADYSTAPYYRLGYVKNDNPYCYFHPLDADNYPQDYGARYYSNSGILYLVNMVNLDSTRRAIDDGDRILVHSLEDRITFDKCEAGEASGFAMQIRGDYIYFYANKGSKNNGENIYFNMRTAEFGVADFVENERQGNWKVTKPANLPQFKYEAFSADSGKITYSKESASVEWSDGGRSFIMDSPMRYAEKKDGIVTARLKSNNEFNPYVQARMHNGYIDFTAAKAKYSGVMHMDGNWLAVYEEASDRVAEIKGDIWYIGEGKMSESTESMEASGTGLQYNKATGELHIGEFTSGVPSGYGARIHDCCILEGEWEGDKLLAP